MGESTIRPGFSYQWWDSEHKYGSHGFAKTEEECKAAIEALDLKEMKRKREREAEKRLHREQAERWRLAREAVESAICEIVAFAAEKLGITEPEVWYAVEQVVDEKREQIRKDLSEAGDNAEN